MLDTLSCVTINLESRNYQEKTWSQYYYDNVAEAVQLSLEPG